MQRSSSCSRRRFHDLMPRLRTATLGLLILALAAPAWADDTVPLAYRDHDGVWRVVYPGDWPSVPPSTVGKVQINARSGTYNVTYLDVVNDTNVGFDDPVLGATRQATLEAVIDEIDCVLGETGTLDIEMQESEVDGGGSLASAGTFYPLNSGFEPGVAFTHLTTGVDPSGAIPDITSTVDFGRTWNSDLDPPTAGEFDLFSVLLHEVTHGLGIAALTGADGMSQLSNANTHSTWEDLLFTGNGKDLWIGSGTFAGVASDLTGGDGGVEFRGTDATTTFGSAPAISAPAPFVSGSSISHWSLGIDGGEAVMQPSIGAGDSRRQYTDWEVAALSDLGYADAKVCDPNLIFEDGFETGDLSVWTAQVPIP